MHILAPPIRAISLHPPHQLQSVGVAVCLECHMENRACQTPLILTAGYGRGGSGVQPQVPAVCQSSLSIQNLPSVIAESLGTNNCFLSDGKEWKESAYNTGDSGLIPGLGRSPGGGSGNHSNILTWEISWTEEPGGLQSMGSQRVGHD